MRVGLVHIGDELLAGKILNTNSRDLALRLGELGHEIPFMMTIPDGVDALAGTLREIFSSTSAAFPACGMLILSGGLGPTHDDLTRQGLAAWLGAPLQRSDEAAAWLGERLGVTPQDLPAGQATQLLVPRGVTPLRNPAGTACGLRVRHGAGQLGAGACEVFAFPGVPSEFRALFEAHCLPLLARGDASLLRRRVVTFGLSESRQRDLLAGFSVPEPFRFSSLPNPAGVTISLEAFAPAAESARLAARLDALWADLLGRLPPECVVDPAGAPLADTVVRLLRERGATVSLAESCTAGLAAHLLTAVPGSSTVFGRAFVTYADDAKQELLGVPRETLAAHGAVSEETARAMARGCLGAARSGYAVAITGIAGPDGGSSQKPVGLVYIAAASGRGERCARFLYREDRDGNRRLAAYAALNLLRLLILEDFDRK